VTSYCAGVVVGCGLELKPERANGDQNCTRGRCWRGLALRGRGHVFYLVQHCSRTCAWGHFDVGQNRRNRTGLRHTHIVTAAYTVLFR